MQEGYFERQMRKKYEEVKTNYPSLIRESIHPLFPNGVQMKWTYPLKPTVQAMYLFGQLKTELSKLNIEYEMALEVGFFTETENRFIDIGVWHKGKKHAIEVHGNTKDAERIAKKTKLLEKHNWIVHNVYNHEIEANDVRPYLLVLLVQSITNPPQVKIISYNENNGLTH